MAMLPAARIELTALARSLGRQVHLRAYHNPRPLRAAHNFTMPAMSPTMTEGNVASWKVKEGDSFSTGDVLLEIETDKASMDVEAQDDGIMAKIIASDGSKGVQVGTRIAVLADAGDDVSSLEIPEDEPAAAPAQSTKEQQQPPPDPAKETAEASEPTSGESRSHSKTPGTPQKQHYPLYPSVIQLMHEKGLDQVELEKIPASGPSGRLLKGDVLAYLGSIDVDEPSRISDLFKRLSHLDLSNIKIAAPPSVEAKPKPAVHAEQAPQAEQPSQVALSISFKAIREVQKRVHDALGIDVPLNTFIRRAVEICNEDLPASKSRTPTADELFDDIVGVNRVHDAATQGSFIPHIIAIAPTPALPLRRKAPDVIDLLSGTISRPVDQSRLVGSTVHESTPSSVFALMVAKGEEKRAKVFLERMKTALQVDPGRLVL